MNPTARSSSDRPLLLDLFCGAGGATQGYVNAGFDVIGVDLNPQPNYPHPFVQEDALALLRALPRGGRIEVGGREFSRWDFEAVHASPPCQGYSNMSNCRPGLADSYPRLIGPVRDLLDEWGLPWVIENVPLARSEMREPVTLCGFMFGRELYRHRLFEVGGGWTFDQPDHPAHTVPASKAGHWRPGTIMSVAGHVAPVAKAREVMEIDWTTREELAEAIPPYYAEYVGRQLLAVVTERRAAA